MAEIKSVAKTKREAKKPLENVNSFLYKLWTLVNDESMPSIEWSHDGEKIVIENPTKFTAKILVANDKQLFKTKNISSFIRQLNLYGFRRVKESSGKIPLIFKHDSFRRGQPDMLVDVKRRRSMSLKQPVASTPLPLHIPKLPNKAMEQNQVSVNRGFPSYPSLPSSQLYGQYFNQNAGGKNAPIPYVTPFAVNHGPTFINMGSHSTIQNKPELPGRTTKEDNKAIQKVDSKEFYNLKVAKEPLYNPWQHGTYYNNTLSDRKVPPNVTVQKAYMQNMRGNHPPYPPPYFHGNMFPIPQLSYPHYGDHTDSISYQNMSQHACSNNPYLPFSSIHAPPYLKPLSLPSLPKTPENSPKLHAKRVARECTSIPSACETKTNSKSLDSFAVFTSSVPTKHQISEKLVCALTADDEKE